MIQSAIENCYITVKFDNGNGGLKTELCHKVLLQLSFYELHTYMQKNATGFSMAYDDDIVG